MVNELRQLAYKWLAAADSRHRLETELMRVRAEVYERCAADLQNLLDRLNDK